jgi:hypothetical protein
MSGVGIYGIKQLAKAQETRHSSPPPNNYPRDYNNYPPQGPQGAQGAGYWGPPGPPPRGPRQAAPREDAYYGENPDQQRQWYPAQGPTDGRYARGYSADYEDERYNAQDGEFVYQARNTPPPYGMQQQGYQREVLPYEPRCSSPAAAAAGLLGTAMEFAGNQQGGDGKKGKKGKGSDMISDFLSR